MENETEKVIANSVRKEVEKESTKSSKKPSNIYQLMKFIKIDGKDIAGGRCKRKRCEIGFSKKDKKRM